MSGPDELRARSLEEAEQHIQSMTARILELEQQSRDHGQRFETLQTPWWRRVWYWIDGWPWHDLNAGTRRHRPWHRS